MQTQYSFSPSQSLFYANALKESVYDPAGIWPEDAFDIDDAVMMEFTSAPPVGKKLGAADGMPVWIDEPPPSAEELKETAEQKKSALKKIADSEISWRQDAVDTDIATEPEIQDLTAWKKFRVLLMRVDTSFENINWPATPGS